MNIEFYDFTQGQADCREGVEHQAGKSEAYDRGYSAEYQSQQMLAHQAEQGCRFARAKV